MTYPFGAYPHKLADDWIKANQLHFKEMLKDGSIKREDVEFYLFVMFGLNEGGWDTEYRKKVEKAPHYLMSANDFDEKARFECSADVLGKSEEDIRTKFYEVLNKTMNYHNKKVAERRKAISVLQRNISK